MYLISILSCSSLKTCEFQREISVHSEARQASIVLWDWESPGPRLPSQVVQKCEDQYDWKNCVINSGVKSLHPHFGRSRRKTCSFKNLIPKIVKPSASTKGFYISAYDGSENRTLLSVLWGPTSLKTRIARLWTVRIDMTGMTVLTAKSSRVACLGHEGQNCRHFPVSAAEVACIMRTPKSALPSLHSSFNLRILGSEAR